MDQATLVEYIAREVLAHLNPLSGGAWAVERQALAAKGVPVAVSVRHIHLAQPEIDILFGPGYALHKQRDLYQPGEFAAEEVVTLVGPRLRSLSNVRVLGPVRKRTQVEISRTDAITLGLKVPVRPSGQLKGAATLTLVGPRGSITLPECCIVANRHIHISTVQARTWGLRDDQRVSVSVRSERPAVLGDVQIRVADTFKLVMHIDTDDANAVGLTCGSTVEITDGE
ncbi:phosphate propanoyltransferase/2-acylglycerol O-acyltransferase [Acididesulfobacillus acetoxydans]|uniref:Phosphate propanoyltransferase n=1 Tax=Acididesulfobacillus acetoxydans TaxID=1561005 RepID=A0A8S0WY57_9FIRM|nr:phosphate propanoyltransferase [Acididesulfobacillus acetoxydans]CAA7601301.1 phosphate propanoyltransferase/2-acylglycerol O-acyltransferase [Acididesulfobacillus acetoxydans]CEJ08789.1 Phosphate propanoyltransferase [Acididesulfobacillus acetoxydans]